MTAISASAGLVAPRTRGSAMAGTAAITARNLRRLTRVPTQAALATLQPILLVVLFTYAFGGAIHVPGMSYVDYLLPGVLLLAIGFGASQTAVAMAEDLANGMIDRFRSLPAPGAAVLAGRAAADAVRNLSVTGIMITAGLALGFRFQAGAAAALAMAALATATGIAYSWVNMLLGFVVRDAETAGLAGLFPVIILTFTSSTLVPVATMPGWLQAFARINPVTVITGALRALSLGGPTAAPVAGALTWIGCVLLAAVPLAVASYRRATSS